LCSTDRQAGNGQISCPENNVDVNIGDYDGLGRCAK